MDKYDLFMKDVIAKTGAGSLKWNVVSPGKYSEFIFQSPYAYQAFATQYSKDGHNYTLVFVNKKMPSHNEDFDIVVEKHSSEILVIENGVLILTLNDSYVSEHDIVSLALEIEDKSQAARDLFKGFQ